MPDQSSRYPAINSAALYAACASGDPLVQAAAYESLWRYLYRVALQVVRDRPEAEALAEECAQVALVRVHTHLAACREPGAFLVWARRVASHAAIDRLRHEARVTYLADDPPDEPLAPATGEDPHSVEDEVLDQIRLEQLHALITQAPISERSRRVVLGRYMDDIPDELLAQEESRLTGQPVLPSHIQVTRAKDIARLRGWAPLRAFREVDR